MVFPSIIYFIERFKDGIEEAWALLLIFYSHRTSAYMIPLLHQRERTLVLLNRKLYGRPYLIFLIVEKKCFHIMYLYFQNSGVRVINNNFYFVLGSE